MENGETTSGVVSLTFDALQRIDPRRRFSESRYDPSFLDLRDATSARLTFASWLSSDASPGEVQVTLDGVTWLTAALVQPSDDWTPVSVDLGAFAGRLVAIRFVFDGKPPDAWRIGNLTLRTVDPAFQIWR